MKNKIPNAGNLIKKNYDAKITDIESKYFTTCYYNKFLPELVDNSAITIFIDNANLNKKVATLAAKAKLKQGKIKASNILKKVILTLRALKTI